ncbi:MAG TPA: AMP-binding protein [Vicinamibacterales bacterium]|nr:AMP-binding protein [Vicinamibacterales bacterium]
MRSIDAFLQARDQLIALRADHERAVREFRWPELDRFNWASDYFDAYAAGNDRVALRIVDEQGGDTQLTFAQLARRSSRIASFLRRQGARRGDRLLLMLPNVVPLWEAILACMKLGLVIVPSTTLLSTEDLRDRFERGRIRHVITDDDGADRLGAIPGDYTRIVVGPGVPGWTGYDAGSDAAPDAEAEPECHSTDPLLLYFTSGTTARPKLVLHTHQSYPVGHLSTMYWIGLREGDVHLNISSPGWAKHAWSNVFAPWTAGATVFVYNYLRFDAVRMLDIIARYQVTTLCAPPTVWRMLVGEDLTAFPVRLREAVSAGEPLNPEVIERVRRAWNLTVRDGYGQTETTAQIGNPPGQPVKDGSMGRPLPGYRVALLDPDGNETEEGEISLRLDPPPLGLMSGYLDDGYRTGSVFRSGYYRTGDVARRDEDGYITYVGRADDVFKSSDYRISPFELESVLVEHSRVAEAAVVPSPDPLRLSVPKAFVVLRGVEPSREVALDIFRFVRSRLSPFKRVRRLEFAGLPKTISGKIRRVELRSLESQRAGRGARAAHEYWEEDFPELRAPSAS